MVQFPSSLPQTDDITNIDRKITFLKVNRMSAISEAIQADAMGHNQEGWR
jgi:hypothetical protein